MSKTASQSAGEVPAGPLRLSARSRDARSPSSISRADELLGGVLLEIASLLERVPPISEDAAWRKAMTGPVYDTVKLYSDREAAFRHLLDVVSTIVVSARQVLSQAAGAVSAVEPPRQAVTK